MIGKRGSIPKTEIEPLGTDWRDHVGRLADQGGPIPCELDGSESRKRKCGSWFNTGNLAENTV